MFARHGAQEPIVGAPMLRANSAHQLIDDPRRLPGGHLSQLNVVRRRGTTFCKNTWKNPEGSTLFSLKELRPCKSLTPPTAILLDLN